MRRRATQRLAVAALAILSATPGGASTTERAAPSGAGSTELGFVHVEANVGGASGGHTALRVGERVFHYQVDAAGELRLVRSDWDAFRFQYGTLENRPLHVAYVPATPDVLRRVEDGFDVAYLEQEREAQALDRTAADLALLDAWGRPGARIPVPGAGLLDADGVPTADGRMLAARLSRTERTLPRPANLKSLPEAGSETAWRERLSLEVARRALLAGWPLADTVRVETAHRLGPPERAALRSLRRDIEETLARWLRAPEPGRAAAVWLLIARHRAAGEALERDRFVSVDPLPRDAPRPSARDVASRRAEYAALATALDARLAARIRRTLAGGTPAERSLTRLENLASRAREYRRAAERGLPPREVRSSMHLPGAIGLVPLPAERAAPGGLAVRRTTLLERQAAASERQRIAHEYDLFTRNCVTELAARLDEVLGGPAESTSQLGGRIGGEEPLAFIPFVYFGKVAARLPAARVERLPAHRVREIERLAADGPAWLALRESNTLTSRIYRPRHADGTFLFFTDRGAAARPLLGAANLAWAAGDAALGLLTAPFDRARRLERAGRGALFSLPELVFVNIRKGSFDAVSLDR